MIKRNKRKNNSNEGKDITSSKLYIFFEWIWRLFVLNTLTIATSLGIITIMPAFVASFRTIKDCYENDETHYIKAYYKNFVYCFKDTVFLGLFLLLIFAMLGYAYYYYSVIIDTLIEAGTFKGWLNIYSMLLGFDIMFFLLLMLVIVQFPMVVTYFHFRFFDKLRFAFYMAYRHMGMSLIIFLTIIANTALLIIAPVYAFYCCFSLPMLITYMVSRRAYWSMANNIEYNENETDEYDRCGKQVNKETYEDNEEKIDTNKVENRNEIKNLEKLNEEIENGEENGKSRD